jgi:hypothetical protein
LGNPIAVAIVGSSFRKNNQNKLNDLRLITSLGRCLEHGTRNTLAWVIKRTRIVVKAGFRVKRTFL